MIRRCEPSRRPYTELCNRSSCPVLQPIHSQVYIPDALEDYWEDASVSLRSCHSWESPSSGWLDASVTDVSPNAQIAESKSSYDFGCRRSRPCRYSFDASDYLGSVKGRRCFPPPLASCSTLSIKGGGRFVLKEMDADRPQGFLRAERENGRLRLQLVLPDEANDDCVSLKEDDSDDDAFDETEDDGEDEDSVVDCSVGPMAGLSEQITEAEHDAHDKEFSNRDHLDCSSIGAAAVREAFDAPCEGVYAKDCSSAYEVLAQEREAFDSSRSLCEQLEDAVSKNVEVELCSVQENVSKEEYRDRRQAGCHSRADVGQFVTEGRFGTEQVDMVGHQQQECLWNVDVANHALPSRSAWTSNQMCLHRSLINIRPALGLAMS